MSDAEPTSGYSDEPTKTNASHGACGKKWWQRGNSTGHCSKCHLTFEGLGLFDWHQLLDKSGNVICRDPASEEFASKKLRLVNGTWRGPAIEEGKAWWPTTTSSN